MLRNVTSRLARSRNIVGRADVVEEAAVLVPHDEQRSLGPGGTPSQREVDPGDQPLASGEVVRRVIVIRLGEKVVGLDEGIARQPAVGTVAPDPGQPARRPPTGPPGRANP